MGDGDTADGMAHLLICFLLHELWEGVRPGFSEGKIDPRGASYVTWQVSDVCGMLPGKTFATYECWALYCVLKIKWQARRLGPCLQAACTLVREKDKSGLNRTHIRTDGDEPSEGNRG